ncbi:MAG: hypothetical protein F6K25_15380 [Okeania sp. SIO2G4]|uniref:hypothetical protein n=1 Tax=unclassified Okeania TaxID=2634635 RepID=UPI0013BA9B3A|nr:MULTISPECIES: hypothetical protein [unclassified Okeania]NEP73324.1 hypothetical protein [Okeania sp. SIO2G5]NEP94153.1 hypothetical protein [Okeania sp. SIO2F5]NEQ92003.1 hypothetical protein [Okeania sp. SIO2G4]
MQETKNNQLFTEISSEESATINGGHGYYGRRHYSYGYRSYYRSRPVRYYSRRRYYRSGYNCY